MKDQAIYSKIKEAVEVIRNRSKVKPEIGMILGSGLGDIASQVTDAVTIPYGQIPHFHRTNVEGHAGQVVTGLFQGVPVAILQGRFHFYEGYPMEEVVFPTRTVCALGVHTLILTNASGGINARYRAGDLMMIVDHLNLMGDNPLRGPNLAQLGPRFPDMTEAYHGEARKAFRDAAQELNIELHEGVYAGLLGPTYETPAEIRMYRSWGADAVGMSTVPECIAANHLGVRVAGISCITNLAAGLSPQKLSHQEVIENSKLGAGRMSQLLAAAIPRLTFKAAGTTQT